MLTEGAGALSTSFHEKEKAVKGEMSLVTMIRLLSPVRIPAERLSYSPPAKRKIGGSRCSTILPCLC
jgi:hypothetical protein